jgi:hypothetical protein
VTLRGLLAIIALACGSPQSQPAAAPAAAAEVPRPPVVRTRGAVRGRIVAEQARYGLGEPIFVTLEVTNTGDAPLVFDVGGDWGPGHMSIRYTWVIRDEHGVTLCDLGRDVPSSQGGGGYVPKLAPGETFRETELLNPACEKMMRPGRYQVTGVRVFTRRESSSSCDHTAPPDVTRLAPGAPDPHGRVDAACMAELARFPAVATDFWLEITPWDRDALTARLARLPAERETAAVRSDNSREGAMTTYGAWFCERIRCDCRDEVLYQRVDDWFTQALSRIPATLPPLCPKTE